MNTIEFKEYDVTINEIIAKVYVTNIDEDLFLTRFTQQPKDFVNGFGAKGMTTCVIKFGDIVPIHSAIKIKEPCTLTEEIMSHLWQQIIKER